MSKVIQVVIFAAAWSAAGIKLKDIWLTQAWQKKSAALYLWLYTFFFAASMTFLAEVISVPFDAYTFPNFSRLLAYIFMGSCLHCVAAATLLADHNSPMVKILQVYLAATLILLVGVYTGSVSRMPEWQADHLPAGLGEFIFTLALYFYGAVLCLVFTLTTFHHYQKELVPITRIRAFMMVAISFLAFCYFSIKTLTAFSFFQPALGSRSLILLADSMMIFIALIWLVTLLNNRLFSRIVRPLVILHNWVQFNDLSYLVESIDRVCPPTTVGETCPAFGEFVKKSDSSLYFAVARSLDGKTLLTDYLANGRSIFGDKIKDDQLRQEAQMLHDMLQSVTIDEDLPEMAAAYSKIGRQLREKHKYKKGGYR